jgi:hypothetical protein
MSGWFATRGSQATRSNASLDHILGLLKPASPDSSMESRRIRFCSQLSWLWLMTRYTLSIYCWRAILVFYPNCKGVFVSDSCSHSIHYLTLTTSPTSLYCTISTDHSVLFSHGRSWTEHNVSITWMLGRRRWACRRCAWPMTGVRWTLEWEKEKKTHTLTTKMWQVGQEVGFFNLHKFDTLRSRLWLVR